MTRAIRIAKGSTAARRGPFASVEEAIAAFRAGKMIIVVDDEDRENEGDLTMAAELVTPEAINFMATHGRGLVCLAMTPERLDALDIPLQVAAELVAYRDGHVRGHRGQGQHLHRHLGARPRGHDSGGGRSGDASR